MPGPASSYATAGARLGALAHAAEEEPALSGSVRSCAPCASRMTISYDPEVRPRSQQFIEHRPRPRSANDALSGDGPATAYTRSATIVARCARSPAAFPRHTNHATSATLNAISGSSTHPRAARSKSALTTTPAAIAVEATAQPTTNLGNQFDTCTQHRICAGAGQAAPSHARGCIRGPILSADDAPQRA